MLDLHLYLRADCDMPSHWRDDTTTVAGIDVQVFSGGRGEPLLVLHGGGGNPGWMPYHQALAEHFHVIAPTHPGFGVSGRSHRWFTHRVRLLDGLIWFYHRFLDSHGFGPLRVMGLCLGGWLAAELATRYPASFSHMVLVGAPGVRPPSRDPFQMTAGQAKAAIFHDPAQVPADYVRGSQGAYRTVAWDWKLADRMTMPSRHNPRLVQSLGSLRIPTLIVWGEHDAMVPAEIGESYRSAIPGAELCVIRNCGHAVYMERPDAFLANVLPFLAREQAAPRLEPARRCSPKGLASATYAA